MNFNNFIWSQLLKILKTIFNIYFRSKIGKKNNDEIEVIDKDGLKGAKAGGKMKAEEIQEPKEAKEQGTLDSRMKSPFRIESEDEQNKRKFKNYGLPQKVEFIPY